MNQSFRTNRVLVVDDDPINRNLIAAQLTKLSCEAVEAEDGRQAWGRLTEEIFDLAIVDLNMPNMNGFELIQCVRGFPRTRHLPVVVVTSHGDSEFDREGARRRRHVVHDQAAGVGHVPAAH